MVISNAHIARFEELICTLAMLCPPFFALLHGEPVYHEQGMGNLPSLLGLGNNSLLVLHSDSIARFHCIRILI
jgi:hypothetical protein